MFDYHMHALPWSPDAFDTTFGMVQAAVAAGLTEICFTQHVDADYISSKVFDFDFAANAREFAQLMQDIRHLPIRVHRGIEMGLQPHLYDAMAKRLQADSFEFIIASVHCIDGVDVADTRYLQSLPKQQAFDAYLTHVLDMVQHFDAYHVVGHIGYPTKGGVYDDPVLHYSDHGDLLDAILRRVIDTGHGLEVNTSGFRRTAQPLPELPILARYRELGGEILTIGADAHKTADVAYEFQRTHEALRAAGFTHLTVFREGRPVFLPIP